MEEEIYTIKRHRINDFNIYTVFTKQLGKDEHLGLRNLTQFTEKNYFKLINIRKKCFTFLRSEIQAKY